MAYLNVEDGTDLKAFEEYLATDYIPKWKEAYKLAGADVDAFMLKVVKGDHKGKYGWMVVFPDAETHTRLFPDQDEFTDVITNAMEEVGLNSAAPEFPGFIDWIHHGDVEILSEF